MKKLVLPVLLAGLLAACGGGSTTQPENETTTSEPETKDITKDPNYAKGLELVSQNDCLTCHKINEVSTGPAYAEIASRYDNAADTTITRLGQKIISGGMGNWGAVPMIPHPGVTQEDAEQMVKYILLLKSK